MNTRTSNSKTLETLTEREFDLTKLELSSLIKRIEHIENYQYKMRQFSISIWLAILGFSIGITQDFQSQILFVILSFFIPGTFWYIDARYSTRSQYFRSRIEEIARVINVKKPTRLVNLDFTDQGNWKNPEFNYKKHILVKLLKRVRLVFYSFQLIGSNLIIVYLLVFSRDSAAYQYIPFILVSPFLILGFFVSKWIIKRKLLRDVPNKRRKLADGMSF